MPRPLADRRLGPLLPRRCGRCRSSAAFTKTLHYLEQSVAHWVLSQDVLAVMIPAVDREGVVKRSEMKLSDYAQARRPGAARRRRRRARNLRREAARPEWAGDRVRDRYEIELVSAFVAAGKPVFGICRGCSCSTSRSAARCSRTSRRRCPRRSRTATPTSTTSNFHAMKLVPGHAAGAAVPGHRRRRRSTAIHHQAIKDLGARLRRRGASACPTA